MANAFVFPVIYYRGINLLMTDGFSNNIENRIHSKNYNLIFSAHILLNYKRNCSFKVYFTSISYVVFPIQVVDISFRSLKVNVYTAPKNFRKASPWETDITRTHFFTA